MQPKLELRRFASLADQLSESVVVTDTGGRITWVNQAFTRLCGYTKPEVLGKRPGSFLQGEDTEHGASAELGDAIREKRPLHSEILNYRKDGTPYWADIHIDPIKGRSGDLKGFVAVVSDISEAVHSRQEKEAEVVEVYGALLAALQGEDSARPFNPRI